MKVLAICASPCKSGNSHVLCDQFLKGAKGIIYGTGTWDKGDVYRHPSFEKAYETGRMTGGSK